MTEDTGKWVSEQSVLDALEQAGLIRAMDVDAQHIATRLDKNRPLGSVPENTVMEQMAQYSLTENSTPTDFSSATQPTNSLLNELPHRTTAKLYRLYINVNLPPIYHPILAKWNNTQWERAQQVSITNDWQQQISPFLSHSETEVALMLRFVRQRNAFFAQHKMLNADEAIDILGLAKKNARRTVRDLANKHQLILLKYENKLQLPAFQFNAKGQVYAALKIALQQASQQGKEALEVAMWLMSDFSALCQITPVKWDLNDVSFSEMTIRAESAITASRYSEIKPIDALATGNEELFNTLVARWLHGNELSLAKKDKGTS